MRRVLVTGGCGFIGSHLIDALIADGFQVVNVDSQTYAARYHLRSHQPGYWLVKADISNLMSGQLYGPFEACYHLAAESHVDRSIADPRPFVTTNVLGTLNMLQVARALQIPVFVHVSTDEVTGDIGDRPPTTRHDPIQASSPYAASKAAGELLARAYYRTYDMDVRIVRPTNTYGPGQHVEKLIPLAITSHLRGDWIPIYGSGMQKRDWMYISDTVSGILATGSRGQAGGVYLLGARNCRTNLDVVTSIFTSTGRAGTVRPVPDRPGHDSRYEQDPAETESELGWRAEVSWQDGLRRTIDWYKKCAG